ncbi:hypothetical protein CSE16_09205 [Solibacillus sp. R5-41]|uniref:hypothetical protein n=1 Tax=Solibacillus sp. R5-41 TaxID=2048654 RepID=UPI000C127185|nr:hypothetical protein [Solibacillus sp. R5-41]ATP40203.1 hypothetical protein CSE16_09205 [Solibacillus sp. R5-41]
MNFKTFLPFTVGISILFGLFFPYNAMATSWVYPFVVWDDSIYVISEEAVTNIDKQIGKVTSYSDMESYGGNFSNVYPKGTKYFSIKGIDTVVAIAIQDKNGKFIKAIREGEYTYKKEFTQYIYQGLGIFAILLVGFFIFSHIRKKG